MTVKTRWYETDSRFIPGHYQPATLIDLALSRDIDSHRLLRGTGLFHEDILAGQTRLSPQQFLALIGNSRRLLDADDSSFLFGQRLLPGHYGAASHALGHAQNLDQALEILIQQQVLLSPLVTLRLELDEHHAYLYWLDSCGAGEHWRFLLEASMTSLVAMSQWLSGERLPWTASFSHAEPRYVEQYWVHLGEDTRFERPLDMLSIPREHLIRDAELFLIERKVLHHMRLVRPGPLADALHGQGQGGTGKGAQLADAGDAVHPARHKA